MINQIHAARQQGTLFSTMATMVSPMHQAIVARPLYDQVAPLRRREHQPGIVHRLWQLVMEWHERVQQRRWLLTMSDHMLRDIGVTRADALAEWEKPFWRA